MIKKMQIKYLQRRKAEWLERLRKNERKEDELLHRNDLNTFVQVHRETELIHYKIDVDTTLADVRTFGEECQRR